MPHAHLTNGFAMSYNSLKTLLSYLLNVGKSFVCSCSNVKGLSGEDKESVDAILSSVRGPRKCPQETDKPVHAIAQTFLLLLFLVTLESITNFLGS